MEKYIIRDGKTIFTRISKHTARKILAAGKEIAFCPVKLRPGSPWFPQMHLDKSRLDMEGQAFDNIVAYFQHYNCNNETGNYTAFYAVTIAD